MNSINNPPKPSSQLREVGSETFWTFAAVEERLVEAVLAWWHCEPGRWPWAADGPWSLGGTELYGPDVDKDAPVRRAPLTRDEIAERDEACAWIESVAEGDRRIVVLGAMQLAAGATRISWKRLRTKLEAGPGMVAGAPRIGERGLGQRYSRALSMIAQKLNAAAR